LLFVRFAAKPRGALESPRVLRGVKKLFQLFPKPFYMLYMFLGRRSLGEGGYTAETAHKQNPRRFCRGLRFVLTRLA